MFAKTWKIFGVFRKSNKESTEALRSDVDHSKVATHCVGYVHVIEAMLLEAKL